jgi:hypothetical protein
MNIKTRIKELAAKSDAVTEFARGELARVSGGGVIMFAPKWEKVMRGLGGEAQEAMLRKMAYGHSTSAENGKSAQVLSHLLHPDKIENLPLARMRLKEAIRDRSESTLVGMRGAAARGDLKWRKRQAVKGRLSQSSYAGAFGENPDDMIEVRHGGGQRYLRDFLSGKSKGYGLEGDARSGIQVHPMRPGTQEGAINDRTRYYAERAAGSRFDRPAIMTGMIRKGDLVAANNGYESAILNPSHIQNAKISPVENRTTGQLPYVSPEWISRTDPIRKGKTFSLPGSSRLRELGRLERLNPESTWSTRPTLRHR